jgi:hypothetical protein
MLEALAAGEADIIIGSRYIEKRGYISSPMRRLGSVILARLISFIVRQRDLLADAVNHTRNTFRFVQRGNDDQNLGRWAIRHEPFTST